MKKPRPTGKLAKPIELGRPPEKVTPENLAIALHRSPPALAQMASKALGSDKIEEELWRVRDEWCIRIEREDRLELLFLHYGIDRTGNDACDFKKLALRMAIDLFSGFRVKDQPKRHKRNNPLTLLLLLADVEAVKLKTKSSLRSDTNALKTLSTEERFEKLWGRMEEKTLLNWLGDARKPEKNPYLRYWKICESRGDLPWFIEMINLAIRGARHP